MVLARRTYYSLFPAIQQLAVKEFDISWPFHYIEGAPNSCLLKEEQMPIHIKIPTAIAASGNKPKIIEEFVGRVNSGNPDLSIARMKSPAGWSEPGQTPDFDEYTVVLHGVLKVTSRNASFDVRKNEAIICRKGEWVQYSTPESEGAEYIAICVPAFSPPTVHRDS